eukprot:m.1387941 g.1387941  ORF g.1387941 m.1387941 type:complete len:1371 (-) comp24985_c0_seq2:183-4295(-)
MKSVFTLPAKVHGDGEVQAKWQKKVGNYLATAGVNRSIHLWDRNGVAIDQFDLQGNFVDMDWSADGSILAVCCEKCTHVTLWKAYATGEKKFKIELNDRSQPTLLLWSQKSLSLAIGTSKGTLVLYNDQTSRTIPIIGKHGNKPITCGSWSSQNLLCLGGLDRTVTLTNENGDTLHQPALHGDPSMIKFFEPNGADGDVMVSIVINRRTLYLWKLSEIESPMELEFQDRYGTIVSYEWFGEGKLLIGFSNGILVIATTHPDHIGQELHQARNHSGKLMDATASFTINKSATCGDDMVLIADLTDPKEVYSMIKLEDHANKLRRLHWTDDGQLLSVCTTTGNVCTYLTKLPMIGSSCTTRVASLSALQEMTVQNPLGDNSDRSRLRIPIPVEPAFMAVSESYAAVGLNNQAWFYAITDNENPNNAATVELLTPNGRGYFGSVDAMEINGDYAAALVDGYLNVHLVEPDPEGTPERESIVFPEKRSGGDSAGSVSAFALTNAFCVYVVGGVIKFFVLEDWVHINDYRHVCGIRKIFADPSGTRLIFIDEKGDVLLLNPITEAVVEVSNASSNTQGVLWDFFSAGTDSMCFVVHDENILQTFVYQPDYYTGARVELVGSTARASGTLPLMLYNGNLTVLMPSGKTSDTLLDTHDLAVRANAHETHPKQCALQNVKLARFADAFIAALNVDNDTECLTALYTAALCATDVTTALRCAQLMGDPGRAVAVEPLLEIEDRNLLCGRIALLQQETDTAEGLFLASTRPVEALWLNRDLLRWDKALELAAEHGPEEIPYISREYAQQMEFTGVFGDALDMYKRGVTGLPKDAASDRICQAGVVRMLIRSGDVRQGMSMADELALVPLYRECGAILQGMNHLGEAAQMFVNGAQYDKAASMYIKLKKWPKAGEILSKVQSAKIVVQYAKAREAEGEYLAAADAYEQAKDYDAVVRLCLDKLQDPDRAVAMVKESNSVEGARLVAQFFMGLNDASSAIEFLFMAGASADAFKLAQANGKMDVFASVLGDAGSAIDYTKVATHFESIGDLFRAAKYFVQAANYSQAVALLLRVKAEDCTEDHMDLAVTAVGLASDDQLTSDVISYLLGHVDGKPKPASFIFKLHMALKQYAEAARTAIVIAEEEQKLGQYKTAHDVLFSMHTDLTKNDIRIPNEMANNLMILHSYRIVKQQIGRKNHYKAARMLIRVANVISKFQEHAVNILTSTVIECYRSGLKATAFEYAALLIRPEYKSKVDDKYKKRLETIVRKPEKTEPQEETSPCCYCNAMVPDTELTCTTCDTIMPYCIVSGRHMVTDDWSHCASCEFPALLSEFTELKADENPTCPMCEAADPTVVKVNDPSAFLKKYKQQQDKVVGDALISN